MTKKMRNMETNGCECGFHEEITFFEFNTKLARNLTNWEIVNA